MKKEIRVTMPTGKSRVAAARKKNTTSVVTTEPEITSIKGFNLDWTCRGFKFEAGKTYEHTGEVAVCESGFHAVEGHPLEVFGYYAPGISHYAEVKQSGKLDRRSGDGKVASARITIGVELTIPDLVARAVRWVMDRAKPEGETATGARGAASATGYQGAASATGDQGAASATGARGAASATGAQGAASATGARGAASATGARGAAMSAGYEGRAMGADGNAIFLVYRDPSDWSIKHAWAGIVGQNGIQPMTWYRLGSDGSPVEVAP